MSKQTINIGASPNDGTGTPLRTSFDYTNQNFTELYTAVGPSGNNIVVPGNATITGDLTVDTSTLKVDSTNNRVGINTATPVAGVALHVCDNVFGASLSSGVRFGNSGNNYYFDQLIVTDGSANPSYQLKFTNQTLSRYLFGGGANYWEWYANNTLGMTLNSTGLGVGASPANGRLIVGADATTDGNGSWNTTLRNTVGAATTAPKTGLAFSGYWNGTSNFANFAGISGGKENTTDANTAGILTMWTSPNGGSPTTRLTIDSSGNVGLGVTPSAWDSANYKALQVSRTSVASLSNIGIFAANWFADTGGDKYIATATAARIDVNNAGGIQFKLAPSGTAGNAITFTQAMTLDASGNCGIGGTPTVRLDVQNASGDVQTRIKSATANSTLSFDYVNNYGSIVIRKSGTDVWLSGVIGDAAATPNYKIQNGSAVGVQLVSGSTAWTTLSDETLKDIIEPISNAVAKIGSLRSVIGKFKTDDSSKRRSFLIAQDVQSVLPEAVDVIGENNELGLRYTEVIPLLVAAIQELTARVQTLEAK